MSTILPPVIRQRYFNANGAPLAGGKLYSYAAGTTTPQATYTDQGGGTPNTNPVILDANGEANVWLDPTLAYKFVLKDSNDATQWTVDQVSAAGTASLPQWNATTNYAQGQIAADDSGFGLLYVSLQDNNVGNALSNVSYWRLVNGNIRTVSANTTLLVTDEVISSDTSAGDLIMTLPDISTTSDGMRISIKDIGTGGHKTKVRGANSDLIDDDDGAYPVMLHKNCALTVIKDSGKWRVLQSGEKIAAMAYLNVTASFTVNTPVIYDVEEIDTHDAYDPATGEFTAPRDDIYRVSTIFRAAAAGLSIWINGSGTGSKYIAESNGNTRGGSVLVALTKGQKLTLVVDTTGDVAGVASGLAVSSFAIESL